MKLETLKRILDHAATIQIKNEKTFHKLSWQFGFSFSHVVLKNEYICLFESFLLSSSHLESAILHFHKVMKLWLQSSRDAKILVAFPFYVFLFWMIIIINQHYLHGNLVIQSIGLIISAWFHVFNVHSFARKEQQKASTEPSFFCRKQGILVIKPAATSNRLNFKIIIFRVLI